MIKRFRAATVRDGIDIAQAFAGGATTRRGFQTRLRKSNIASSRHVILTIAMEANMTEARLEMLGLWIFLMLIVMASHLYQ